MKRAFLVRFLVAMVLSVSTVAVQGRAVVTVVSCWPVSVIAVVSSVSTSHVARPVREIVRPAWPDRGCERDKVRPARSKHPKCDVFEVAGRTLSWVEWGRGRTGRILSRLPVRYCHRPWLGHRPRPRRHTLRCLGTPTSASVWVLQH